MEELLQQFLCYLNEVKQVSANTYQAYATDLKLFLSYLCKEGVEDLTKVNETRVQAYLLYQRKKKKSTATIARSLASMKSFFLFLIKKRVIDEDPTERIHPPKVEKTSPKCISYQQMKALLEAPEVRTLHGRRDRAILELLYATGIRASELIDIQRSDLNLTFGSITIRGEGRERVLPLGETVKEKLTEYLNDLEQSGVEQEYLFVSRLKTPFTRQGIYKMVKQYAILAGISDDISLQVIRNSFATHMIENGADLNSMQEILGISEPLMAQKYMPQTKANTFRVYKKSHPRN